VIDIVEVNRVVNIAVTLAAQGLPVFPCHAETKAPAPCHGFYDATTDVELVPKMWLCHPELLIGYPTGEISGIDVLDVDLARHPEAARWWEAHAPRLPVTMIHQTRSGGLHVLFRHQPGRRNSQGEIATGVDVRGIGGYAIAWAALGCPVICDAELADWPAWLDPAKPPPIRKSQPRAAAQGRLTRYGEAALDSACRNIIGAMEGCQQATLNAEVFSIGTLVAADGLPQAFALQALLWAACQIPAYDQAHPWQIEKLQATVRRAFAASTMARPRSRPNRQSVTTPSKATRSISRIASSAEMQVVTS